MAAFEELERRVAALEAAQNDTTQTLRWSVAKLGRISSVQDEHTLRLERIESDVRRVEAGLKDLRADLPGIVIDAVREGIKAAREG
jgi:chromosome segregation ATPase